MRYGMYLLFDVAGVCDTRLNRDNIVTATGGLCYMSGAMMNGLMVRWGVVFAALIASIGLFGCGGDPATVHIFGPPAPDTAAPSNPTGLTANPVSSSQINISWTAATDDVGVTEYRVERCQGAGCMNFAQIGTTAGAVTTLNDAGLTPNASYSNRVRATDTLSNLGPYSNVASAMTLAPDTQAPTAPGNLTANAICTSTISLS